MMKISINRVAKYLLVAILPMLLLSVATDSSAGDRMATVGVLLCTTANAPANGNARKTLSCNFDGIAGGDGGLQGRIVLKGEASLPSSKHVLMWSVLAPKTDVKSSALVGKYRETDSGRLVGGKDGSIVLTPATSTARTRDAAITGLELQLDPVKA